MGFGTNRVVSRQLNKTGLSATQLKGMDKLRGICDVKKNTGKENEKDVIDKLSAFSKGPEHNKNKMLEQITGVKSAGLVGSLGGGTSLGAGNTNTNTNTNNTAGKETKKKTISLKSLMI